MTDRLVLTAMLAAALTLALGRWGIPTLRRLNVQQRIREEAPAQHRGKAGTPTMGGLLLVPAAVVTSLVTASDTGWRVLLPLAVMLAYGAVGAVDDALSIRHQRNLGLRARERLALQVLLAAAVAVYVTRRPGLGTALAIPGIGLLQLGWLYAGVVVVYIVGFTNAVNLSDGLDGLAAGISAITCRTASTSTRPTTASSRGTGFARPGSSGCTWRW